MYKKLLGKGLYLGTDGCKGGWITAALDHGKLRIEKYRTISELIENYPRFDAFLLDMAIGLRNSSDQLRPDDTARKELSPRGSTLFPIPSRSAVYAETEEEQKQANLRTLGKSLPKQTINIIPKIREVDEFFDAHPEYRNKLHESHPELSFARLNGEVLMSKKKEAEGLKQRLDILNSYFPGITWSEIYEKAREYRCNPDDVLDAICLAITAGLKANGLCETIPEAAKIEKDEKGLNMSLTLPKKDLAKPIKNNIEKHFKLEIFIPETHFADLRKTLQSVDAGHIGNYDCCLSYSKVIGTWRPLPGTDPFIGEEGVISEEEELKVEVTVRGKQLDETISAIKEVHPYEEPVINVIELYRTGLY